MFYLFILGRIIVGLFFIHNAYGHLMHYKSTALYAKMKGVPMPEVATVFTGLMLLVGGLSVMLGIYPFIGVIILIIFLVPTTLIMHQYWKMQDPMQKMGEKINFLKNWALIGLLLMLL